MTDRTSPKGNSGDFAKKVQRQLSRGKEKVLQKLGKLEETRDDLFENYVQQLCEQQSDGHRIYKDLRNYIDAVRDMREASRRLSQSLFDVYESDWVGQEDIGAIVEGEDLLWNDHEVKLLDQAVRTMESYLAQFPDIREKVSKRGRKLVDYDSSRHRLESLQTAKKRDDVKIAKAEEEMNDAKRVYQGIDSELKEELPVLHDSRIGCYVTVFSAISSLRDIFYKEMRTLNMDLHNVVKELQAQHPDKAFAVKGMLRYGSLRRRTLLSPRAWKASFSDFHRNYSPKGGPRFSFRSPEKAGHGTLSRESGAAAVSAPESACTRVEMHDLCAREDAGDAGSKAQSQNEKKDDGESLKVEDAEEDSKAEESEANSPTRAEDEQEEAGPSESGGEPDDSCDSESLELRLSAAENDRLADTRDAPKAGALDNGDIPGFDADGLQDEVTCAESRSTEV